MKYKIKYNSQTGNSFGSYTNEEVLEFEWENLDVAKLCLKRIEEHYEWYKDKEYRGKNEKKPKWWNCDETSDRSAHHCINLLLDNDTEVQFWCPWCGYFESLNFVEIIPDTSGMKIYM